MNAKIIDGFSIAAQKRAQIAQETASLGNLIPCLAVILIGENPASISYVTAKAKALLEAGMKDKTIRLPQETSEEHIVDIINQLNKDSAVHGILVQLPLPPHINSLHIIEAISPQKDVDGFSPINIGKMILGEKCFLPCTPHGILELLHESKIETQGAHAVIVGRSNLVGRPLSILLSNAKNNATVTLCHTGTKDLQTYTKNADILIVAVGKPQYITAHMVKKNATVIDVGVNRLADSTKKSGFRLCGDVDFENVCKIAGAITPVPRGVGPMTIAMLLQNILQAAKNTQESP